MGEKNEILCVNYNKTILSFLKIWSFQLHSILHFLDFNVAKTRHYIKSKIYYIKSITQFSLYMCWSSF